MNRPPLYVDAEKRKILQGPDVYIGRRGDNSARFVAVRNTDGRPRLYTAGAVNALVLTLCSVLAGAALEPFTLAVEDAFHTVLIRLIGPGCVRIESTREGHVTLHRHEVDAALIDALRDAQRTLPANSLR